MTELTEADTLRRKVESLSSLIQVTQIVTSTLDLSELLDRVMETAKRVMSAEASSLMLQNEEGDLSYEVATGEVAEQVKARGTQSKSKGIAGWVATHERPLNIPDAYADDRFDPSWDKQTGFRTKSVLCVPLRSRERTIGVASVYNKLHPSGGVEAFDEDDISLFTTYCAQVAIAIENARLHRESLERERFERDLDLARQIQESFLPRELPQVKGYRFFARNRPSEVIGGDLYDLLTLDCNQVIFNIGDVTGKGISAALYMARFLSDFRIQATDIRRPQHIFKRINQEMANQGTIGMFVTMFGGILDYNSGRVEYVNAGHPAAMLRRKSGEVEYLSEPGNPPLGVLEDLKFECGRAELRPGDCLLLYTDGITEAMDAEGLLYEQDRLEEHLRRDFHTPDELGERIEDSVLAWSRRGRRLDDLTMLIIHRLSTAPTD